MGHPRGLGWVEENRQRQRQERGGRDVSVPQPSGDQAPSGWGTRFWGGWLRRTVVCFRKRYPTLSDDETVGKGGAPGSVVTPVLGRFTHLSDDGTVAKMGHPVWWWAPGLL